MLCYLYKLHYVDAMKVAFNHFFALQYYFELKFSCKKYNPQNETFAEN